MGAIAPIDFEKGLTAPINFRWKQESKGILHPCIEILNGLLGILHPSIEIPNDTPGEEKPLLVQEIAQETSDLAIKLLCMCWSQIQLENFRILNVGNAFKMNYQLKSIDFPQIKLKIFNESFT